MTISKDLVAASATPLVLAILAGGESYGYAIIKQVGELSGERIQWTDGMLYPVLHRLEKSGWIESCWKTADSGRRRRYYRIAKEGLRELEEQKRQWQAVQTTLDKLWPDPPEGGGTPLRRPE